MAAAFYSYFTIAATYEPSGASFWAFFLVRSKQFIKDSCCTVCKFFMHREYSWHIIKYAEFFRVKKKAQLEVTSSNQKLEELHEEDLVSLVVKSPEELWCYMVVVLKVRENEWQNISVQSFAMKFLSLSSCTISPSARRGFWSAI